MTFPSTLCSKTRLTDSHGWVHASRSVVRRLSGNLRSASRPAEDWRPPKPRPDPLHVKEEGAEAIALGNFPYRRSETFSAR